MAGADHENELDDDEWESTPVGRVACWLMDHPDAVELGRHAPDVAQALGESSQEIWIWAEGGEMLDPDTLLTYLHPDATRRAAEAVGRQSAREWNAHLDEALEREVRRWEERADLPVEGPWGPNKLGELAAFRRRQDAQDRETVLEIALEVQAVIASAAGRGWGILSYGLV